MTLEITLLKRGKGANLDFPIFYFSTGFSCLWRNLASLIFQIFSFFPGWPGSRLQAEDLHKTRSASRPRRSLTENSNRFIYLVPRAWKYNVVAKILYFQFIRIVFYSLLPSMVREWRTVLSIKGAGFFHPNCNCQMMHNSSLHAHFALQDKTG